MNTTKKNYTGGWKDRSLRSGAVPSTPIAPPERLSDHWTLTRREPDVRKLTVGGEIVAVVFAADGTAFEICPRCLVALGRLWAPRGEQYVPGPRRYNFGRCTCPPEGATIADVSPVPVSRLISGMALSILTRAGIETTHDLARYGSSQLTEVPGIGPGVAERIRAAVEASNLPQWPEFAQ